MQTQLDAALLYIIIIIIVLCEAVRTQIMNCIIIDECNELYNTTEL